MEPKDFYYIISALVMVVGGIVSLVSVYWELKSRISLLAQEVANEKEKASELKGRLEDFENKIAEKLESILERIAEIREMVVKGK